PLRGAVHDFALLYLGVHLFDNCDLEALADAAADRRRWDFLLTAAPLPIRGGTGSPANPLPTFLRPRCNFFFVYSPAAPVQGAGPGRPAQRRRGAAPNRDPDQ